MVAVALRSEDERSHSGVIVVQKSTLRRNLCSNLLSSEGGGVPEISDEVVFVYVSVWVAK